MLQIDENFASSKEKSQQDKIQQEVQALTESIEKLKGVNSDLQLRIESKDEVMESLRKEIGEKETDLEMLRESNKEVSFGLS